MPLTDSEEDSFLFPVKEIVQYPLSGYVAPSSISFSPDGRLISYLFSPDGTLHRKVFAFDVASRRQELVICSPDGGDLDESLEPELKLTCCASSPIIDPHLSPDGSMLAYVKDDELHVLNPFGGEPKQLTFGAIANRKLDITVGTSYRLLGCLIIKCSRSLEPVGILMYTTVSPQAVWGVSEQQHNKKVEATVKELCEHIALRCAG
ncbi:hypothetical protein ZIOFF_008280 [Zingiber officinale]|uniref:Uncharacterized protein n=1 Tax=Zingiber officinale TaxID=94328 RepID=A0A8J5IHZ4_ZINOF|nr:hypothetical protein ZIOFF_008280 [Zingiber officinale]